MVPGQTNAFERGMVMVQPETIRREHCEEFELPSPSSFVRASCAARG